MSDLRPDYMVKEGWTGDERRGIDGITLKLMAEMRAMMEKHEKMEGSEFMRIEGKFDDLKEEIEANAIKSDRRHEEMLRRMDQMQQSTMNLLSMNNQTVKEIHELFKRSIPNEDPEGHKNAHVEMINEAQERREFYKFLKRTVVAAVAVGLLGWMTNPIWQAFLQGPK